MRQSGAETLVTEEPYELIAHVRICGGAGWVTTGSTRKPTYWKVTQVKHALCDIDTHDAHLWLHGTRLLWLHGGDDLCTMLASHPRSA
jgi:hypothetical protein